MKVEKEKLLICLDYVVYDIWILLFCFLGVEDGTWIFWFLKCNMKQEIWKWEQ